MEVKSKHIAKSWWLTPILVLIVIWGVGHSSSVLTGVTNYFLNGLVESGSRFSVERVEGSAFSSLTVHGMELASESDSTSFRIETIEVAFRLRKVFSLTIDEIRLSGLESRLQRRPQGDFVIPTFKPSSGNETAFALGLVSAQKMRLVVIENDSTRATIEDAEWNSRDIVFSPDQTSLKVDTLWAHVKYPETETKGSLGLRFELGEDKTGSLQLSALSERSSLQVSATGSFDSLSVSGADSWTLLAEGVLMSADLEPFIPGLTKTERFTIRSETSFDNDSTKIAGSLTSLGAGQVTFSTVSHPRSDSLFHTLRISASNIEPGQIFDSYGSVSGISATLTGNGFGTSIAGLQGTLNVAVSAANWDQIGLLPSEISGQKDEKGVSSTIKLKTTAGSVSANLTLAEDGSFKINGRASNLDFIKVESGLPTSNLNAAFSSSGSYLDNALSGAEVSLAFSPSTIGTCRIQKGSITGRYTPALARIQTALDICSNEPFMSTVSIANPTKDWRISSTNSVKGLLISELLELEEAVSMDANAVVNYSKNGTVSGNILVQNLRYGSTTLDSIEVAIKGKASNLVADAKMALGGGSISAQLLLKDNSRLVIQSGVIEHLDAFDLTDALANADSLAEGFGGEGDVVAGYSSDLSGSFNGLVEFGEAGLAGDLQLHLLASRINRQDFQSNIVANWNPEKASAVVHFTSADSASFRADLNVELTSNLADMAIQLEGWDILPFLNLDGQSELVGKLVGSATLSNDFPFEIALDLNKGSSLNRVDLESLTSNIQGTSSRFTGALDFDLPEGGHIQSSFELDSLNAMGHFNVKDTDVAALLGIKSPSRLSTSISAEANKSNIGWDQIDVRVDSLSAEYEHLALTSGSGSVHISPSLVHFDSLAILGSFGEAMISGTLPRVEGMNEALLTYSVRLNNELSRISQIKELNLGFFSGQAEGRFEGPFGQTRLTSSFSLADAYASGMLANQISGRLLGELDTNLALSAAEIVADARLLEIDPVAMERATITASYDGTELSTSFDVHIEENRDVSARVLWLPFDAPSEFTLLGLNASLDGDEWKMTGSSTFDSELATLSSPIVLQAGEQRIVAISSVSDGTVRNLVTVQKLRIDTFADLMTYPEVGGVLGGTLTATTLDGVTELQGSVLGSVTAFGKAVGDLNFQFSDDGSQTRLNAGLKDIKGESLQLSGTIPRFNSQDEVQMQISAESYSIDWIRSLLDPELLDELKGRVNGEIRISGTPTQPSWSGLLRLQDGVLGLPVLGKRRGMQVTNIQSNFRFNGEVIEVDSLRARSGDGWLRGSGTIDIKDLKLGEYNIAITASDFKAIDSPDYFAVVSGQISLGGTTDRPKIGGRITVNRGDFWLSDATTSDTFEPLTLSDEDLNVLQRRFGLRIAPTDTTTFDAYDVLALEDFTVRMERDTWIRSKSNPRMDIQLTGDLDVRKQPKQDPEVFGSITVLPERSRIVQFGKRFELDRGELTFNGPMTTPDMNMEASYTVPSRTSDAEEVTIRLLASGSPDNLEVSFASDPAMELADIVSYIATGRPAAASLQISGSQTDTYLQSAAGLAIGPVADLIENMASSGLGLDVIEIEHTGFSGLTLTAGKYVSPRLYVSVSQPISLSTSSESSTAVNKNQTQVTIEYELVRQLLLSLLNRGTILRVNLRWQHAF